MDKNNTTKSITIESLAQNLPLNLFGDNIDENYQKAIDWFDSKYGTLSPRTKTQLLDSLAYVKDIEILGTNNKSFKLSFNKFIDNPEPELEVQFDITISFATETISRGYIKPSIDYLNFDKNKCALDGN